MVKEDKPVSTQQNEKPKVEQQKSFLKSITSWFTLPVFLMVFGLIYCFYVIKIFWGIVLPHQAIYDSQPKEGYFQYGFQEGDNLSMSVWIDFVSNNSKRQRETLWTTNVTYGEFEKSISTELNLTVPINLLKYNQNDKTQGTSNIFVSFTKINPENSNTEKRSSSQLTFNQLIEFDEPRTERLLLESSSKQEEIKSQSIDINKKVAYYNPKIIVKLVHESAQYPTHGLPFYGPNQVFQTAKPKISPIAFIDHMSKTKSDLSSLQNLIEEAEKNQEKEIKIPISIEYKPITAGEYRLHGFIAHVLEQQSNLLKGSEKEIEEIRLLFVENSPLVLLITVFVAVFHLIFEFLSLKNDVSFWKSQNSREGISFYAITLQTISKFIILLYLNEEKANIIVRIGVFGDLLVSLWKLKSLIKINFSPFSIKFSESYQGITESSDLYAIKQLSKILIPLIFGYLIYSVVYEKHKSWYSFTLNWLAGCVYAFGFILMTPQLFLNYKLKSVAHLPWRAMVYRFLNTFIDDLFAFIIKMPVLHRVSVFRDDIVFFIYLYQRYIYPVDKSRTSDLDENSVSSNKNNDNDNNDNNIVLSNKKED